MKEVCARLSLENLESRDNPSSGWSFSSDDPNWSFWKDNYIGAALSGISEGAINIGIGAKDAVVEVVRTGRDLGTIYGNWNSFNPSQLESKLFQGAAATAGDSDAAFRFDLSLTMGIITLGVSPLVESGYNAVVTGDVTQFSQQAGVSLPVCLQLMLV